jgi:hypothetical protein
MKTRLRPVRARNKRRVLEKLSKVLAEQFVLKKDLRPETRPVGHLHAGEHDIFEFAVGLESDVAAEPYGLEKAL